MLRCLLAGAVFNIYESNDGLSAGAVGGIVGGAVGGVALLALLILLCCCWQKKSKRRQSDLDYKGQGVFLPLPTTSAGSVKKFCRPRTVVLTNRAFPQRSPATGTTPRCSRTQKPMERRIPVRAQPPTRGSSACCCQPSHANRSFTAAARSEPAAAGTRSGLLTRRRPPWSCRKGYRRRLTQNQGTPGTSRARRSKASRCGMLCRHHSVPSRPRRSTRTARRKGAAEGIH